MSYKCLECGHLFEDGEEAVWSESRGEYWGIPCYETVTGCPICKGSYEETTPCVSCGKECFNEELEDGLCETCVIEEE